MIAMSENLELRKTQGKNAAKISTFFLILAMLTMAVWGWTPLKNIIPAAANLGIFGIFLATSMFMAGLTVYRGLQTRALEAKIEDQS